VNDLLERMTTDEKIDLISGDTPFRTHAIARLNIPYFQMADGPVGVHIPAPTIAYAADWLQHGIRIWLNAFGLSSRVGRPGPCALLPRLR
jgi:hypothetical protein